MFQVSISIPNIQAEPILKYHFTETYIYILYPLDALFISGNKYVPPHLRKSQGSGGNNSNSNQGRRDSGYAQGSGDRGGGGGDRGGYGGGDRRESGFSQTTRGSNSSAGGPPPTNSRWNDNGGNGGGGGYEGGGGGGGGYNDRRGSGYSGGGAGGGGGGRFGGGGGGGHRNERGFQGDMNPDKRVEARLFDNSDKQATGINFDNYDKIPVEVSGEDCPDPIEEYSADTIGEDLFRNTLLCGYTRPTPVQKYSVPIGRTGRDLMACAQTGSGKTAGFLFPIIMAMIRNGGKGPPMEAGGGGGRRRTNYPEAIILAPTRELAQQIFSEGQRFTYTTGIAPVCIYGGADVRDQLRQIEQGCDLLVATPGRLVDLMDRGRLGMENVQFLVLDEADRMLDMGCKFVIIQLLWIFRFRIFGPLRYFFVLTIS